MAATKVILELTCDASATEVSGYLNKSTAWTKLMGLMYMLRRVKTRLPATIGFTSGSQDDVTLVKAAGAVTFGGDPTADETLTVCNITFTAKASGATGNQFNIGTSVTITATNLKTAINASSDLTGKVVATSSGGVVTITAVVPGLHGNGYDLTESMANTTKTAFASGAIAIPSVYMSLLDGTLT
jgi:phage tail sheath gpL-like